MDQPRPHLIDSLVDFATENRISIEEAGKTLIEFAKQRAPEKEIEDSMSSARSKLRQRIFEGPKEYIVARFLLLSRVRYVRWTYYLDFHVVSAPQDFWGSTITYSKPWRPAKRPAHLYLDDLFYDREHERFWMEEPYLADIPTSLALFTELTRPDFPKLEGTAFRKIAPTAFSAFRELRKTIPEYRRKPCDFDKMLDRRPYGSKGWKTRATLVPATYKKVRFR